MAVAHSGPAALRRRWLLDDVPAHIVTFGRSQESRDAWANLVAPHLPEPDRPLTWGRGGAGVPQPPALHEAVSVWALNGASAHLDRRCWLLSAHPSPSQHLFVPGSELDVTNRILCVDGCALFTCGERAAVIADAAAQWRATSEIALLASRTACGGARATALEDTVCCFADLVTSELAAVTVTDNALGCQVQASLSAMASRLPPPWEPGSSLRWVSWNSDRSMSSFSAAAACVHHRDAAVGEALILTDRDLPSSVLLAPTAGALADRWVLELFFSLRATGYPVRDAWEIASACATPPNGA